MPLSPAISRQCAVETRLIIDVDLERKALHVRSLARDNMYHYDAAKPFRNPSPCFMSIRTHFRSLSSSARNLKSTGRGRSHHCAALGRAAVHCAQCASTSYALIFFIDLVVFIVWNTARAPSTFRSLKSIWFCLTLPLCLVLHFRRERRLDRWRRVPVSAAQHFHTADAAAAAARLARTAH